MRLKHKTGDGILSKWLCDLTTELDNLAELDNGEEFHRFHYIIVDEHSVKEKCLPIRVYGGTVGGIWFDEDKIITKLIIDTNYIVKSYPENVNEIIQKYVGQKLSW